MRFFVFDLITNEYLGQFDTLPEIQKVFADVIVQVVDMKHRIGYEPEPPSAENIFVLCRGYVYKSVPELCEVE